jgi:hypothetical protein
VDERTLRPRGAPGQWNPSYSYEHRTTPLTLAVNCEACKSYLPEVVALRKHRQERGSAVVEALAQLGISSSYENRDAPLVSLHVDEAEKLLAAFAGLQQVASQLQGAAEFLGFAGPAQPGDVIPHV